MSVDQNQTRSNLIVPTLGALVGCALFATATALVGVIALPTPSGRLYDFRAFYSAGYMVLHDPSHLFDPATQVATQNAIVFPMWRGVPFYHPAYEALLYAPFSLLNYRHAYLAYLAWNVMLLLGCYCLAPKAMAGAVARLPRGLLLLGGLPVFMCAVEGQNSILFLCAICLVWRAAEANQLEVAGMLLGLSAFKLPVVVVMAALLSLRLGLRFLKGTLVGAGTVLSLSVAISGIHGAKQWADMMFSSSLASHLDRHVQSASAVYVPAMPSLNGFLSTMGGAHLRPSVSILLDAILSLGLLASGAWLVRRSHSMAVIFTASICCALLLSPHLYLYDYAALLLPVFLLSGRHHLWIVAGYYAAPWALFATKGLDLLSILAVIPMAWLFSLLLSSISSGRDHKSCDRPPEVLAR